MSQCGRSVSRPGACRSLGWMAPACRSLGRKTPTARGPPTLPRAPARARRRWRLPSPLGRQVPSHRPKTSGRKANSRLPLARRGGWFVEMGAPFQGLGFPRPQAELLWTRLTAPTTVLLVLCQWAQGKHLEPPQT
jgi:hypothetical protein